MGQVKYLRLFKVCPQEKVDENDTILGQSQGKFKPSEKLLICVPKLWKS
jgi:hypothetical protein